MAATIIDSRIIGKNFGTEAMREVGSDGTGPSIAPRSSGVSDPANAPGQSGVMVDRVLAGVGH